MTRMPACSMFKDERSNAAAGSPVRAPSFVNLQALDVMCRGQLVADVIAVIGTLDIVLGEVDR